MRFPSASQSRTWRRRGASKNFGFKSFGGNASQNWLILKNGDHVIGLFQGMFEKNILAFNPGWDETAIRSWSISTGRNLECQSSFFARCCSFLLQKGSKANRIVVFPLAE